jgi:hypothetical protein
VRKLSPLLLAILLGAPAVWAALQHARARETEHLLVEVATANGRTSYRGHIGWKSRWKKSSGLDVRHDAVHGRTAYCFGKGREFVLDHPSGRMPDPTAWCRDPGLLSQNYVATEKAPRSFLDRDVRVLSVKPRHRGRPSLEIWADALSGLALKVTTFRADGSVYRVSKFESIEFGAQEVAARELQQIHKFRGTVVPLDDPAAAAGFAAMIPDYAPAGFELVEARVRQRATPELSLLYSDGATAFELKQSPRVTPAALEEHYKTRMSDRWASRRVRWHVAKAARRLVRTGGDAPTTAVCRSSRRHATWDLQVAGLDLKLVARDDLDRSEMTKVLRSLRVR